MCYPQQLGRSWKDFVPEPSGTLSAMCNGHLSNSVCYLHHIRNFTAFWTRTFRNLTSHLHQNSPEACLLSANMPSNSPQTLRAICTGTLRTSSAIRNPPEPCLHHAVQTSSAICTGTLWNFISHLRWNPPEPHQPSAPEPSGTSSAICTGTRRNLVWTELSGTSSALFSTGTLRNLISCTGTLWKFISHLHRNPPEPHQPSAPEPSGTLRNPPEPFPEPGVATAPDRTRAILG